MDFSPELLAAAERKLALLSLGNTLVEQNENEFDQELFERIPPEEFQNLLDQLTPARPPRPKRKKSKRIQPHRDREEFERANLVLFNRREFERRELGTGRSSNRRIK